MTITQSEIQNLYRLANLPYNPKDSNHIVSQITSIIELIGTIQNIDIDATDIGTTKFSDNLSENSTMYINDTQTNIPISITDNIEHKCIGNAIVIKSFVAKD